MRIFLSFTIPLLLLSLSPSSSAFTPIPDKPYFEDISTRFLYSNQRPIAQWALLPFSSPSNVTQVVADNNVYECAWILTLDSLWQFWQNGTSKRMDEVLKIPIHRGMQITANPKNLGGGFTLVSVSDIYIYYGEGIPLRHFVILNSVTGERILSLTADTQGTLYFSSDIAVYNFTISNGVLMRMSEILEAAITLYWSEGCGLAIGTVIRLWRPTSFMYPGSSITSGWRYEWVGNYDAPISALSCDRNNTLWIGNNESITLQYSNGTFSRIGRLTGLPFGNVTSISRGFDNEMIIGTKEAVLISRDAQVGTWSFYMGNRWLPSGPVLSTSVGTNSKNYRVLYVATETGIAVIERQLWTLEQKALYFENIVDLRHNRWGLVADSNLQKYGDLSSSLNVTDDNDGLWTSIFVTSQAFRYGATKDPNVQSRAWTHFEAIKMLQDVTPIVGLPARSYVKQGEAFDGGTWYNSTTIPGWTWKADTSSDEIVGHMMVYPIAYDLLAITAAQKQDAYNCAINLMSYIVNNNLYLVDVTGKPTTWGRWNPLYLNDNPEWFDDRGLNSLQILAFLSAAYRLSGNKTFLDTANTLILKNGYGLNMINQKIEIPSDDNYSDDELAWLPYLTYFYNQGLDILKNAGREFHLSIDRAWGINNREKPSLWNIIYGVTQGSAATPESFHLSDAIWSLQNWPTELITWPFDNRVRVDLFLDQDATRFGDIAGVWWQILPPKETGFHKWNDDPYTLHGNDGMGESDPSAFLLPYWMARYYGFIAPPSL